MVGPGRFLRVWEAHPGPIKRSDRAWKALPQRVSVSVGGRSAGRYFSVILRAAEGPPTGGFNYL